MKPAGKMFWITACVLLIMVGTAWADDIEIFGGGQVNVPPNVLIIFDNSGSMDGTVDVIPQSYDGTVQYDGPYNRAYVYRSSWWGWDRFEYIGTNELVDADEIVCDAARNALNTYGHWQGRISSRGTHSCGYSYSTKRLRTGNYVNYLRGVGSATRKKIDIAKETVNELVDTTSGVRFGVMVFNSTQGGHLVAPLASRETQGEKDALKAIVDGLSASSWTPLAETMAEAGLYFAREESWCNSGVDYATDFDPAVLWRCQKNYVVLITDGASTEDRGSVLTRADYMLGKPIGDYDGDGNDPGSYYSNGSDYLDDVAKFLYDEDILPASITDSSGVSFDSSDFAKQNIVTYTVGFAINHTLLEQAADSNHGQGDYFTTEAQGGSGVSLAEILESIIVDILEHSSDFVAPVVPVSRQNKTFADNAVYLGVFSPDSKNPGQWLGNLKKFGLDVEGKLLDRDLQPATDDAGAIKEGAKSAWYHVTDALEGMTVDKGGVGTVLLSDSSRVFKTRETGSALVNLNDTSISAADLGVADDTTRSDLLDYVTGSGIYAPTATGDGTRPRAWVLGDILHSRPALLYDDSNDRNLIFVGANDGFLHCFMDSDQGTSDDLTDDVVEELWAFTPWELVPQLKNLPPEDATLHVTGDQLHDYFVDGSPEVYRSGISGSFVCFGLRRGGYGYTALDIADYQNPVFAWEIGPTLLTGELLGQSWGKPRFVTIWDVDASQKDVLLLPGGYDPNQDFADPGAADTRGRAVFAVGAATGALHVPLNFNHSTYSRMNYSIADLTSFDANNDGCEDVIYASSLGGEVFVFADKDGDGIWAARHLFTADKHGGTTGLRKMPRAPSVAVEPWGDYVYFGSGDREDPSKTTVTNRMYALKNQWATSWDDANDTFSDSDLVDVSDGQLQDATKTADEKEAFSNTLAQGNGWYLNLENSGEKVVSSPVVFGGVVYFTTFTPGTAVATDPCVTGSGSGTARLYAVDYLNGNAVVDFTEDGTVNKNDRSLIIGSGIPSDPVVLVTEKTSEVMIAAEDRVFTVDVSDDRHIYRYYWQQR